MPNSPAELDADPTGETVVLLRLADGRETRRPLDGLRASEVVAGLPWQAARSIRGQRHFPGFYWSATTGRHVLYESRLELAWLLCADFDPAVVGIAAQPFGLRSRVGDRPRRHVPDFLWLRADGSAGVVNVKPATALTDPDVAEALAWPGRLVEAPAGSTRCGAATIRSAWRTCAFSPGIGDPA